MTKIRVVMVAAVLAIAISSVCGEAQAQTAVRKNGKFTLFAVQKTSDNHVSPDGVSPAAFKLPGVTAGLLSMGASSPPDGSGNPYWFCFTGSGPDCTSLPSGGWVGGLPYQAWSLSTCSTTSCADIYSWFTGNTTDATDDLVWTFTAKQGTNFIYNTGPIDFGPNTFTGGALGAIYGDGAIEFGLGSCSVGTCSTPVAGKVTLTAVFTVGKKKATSTSTIYLQ